MESRKMAIPESINDLSVAAEENSPQGGDNIGGTLDDYLRNYAVIMKRDLALKAAETAAGTSFTPAASLLSKNVQAAIVELDTKVSGLTKTSVGLSNVDNTSDMNKPISVHQQNAINNLFLSSSAGDIDPDTITDPCLLIRHAKMPHPTAYFYVTTRFYLGISPTANCVQTAEAYHLDPPQVWTRRRYNDVWTPWTALTTKGLSIETSTPTIRNSGLVGSYDNAKIDQIWAMGPAYQVATSGANYGTLYGMAYAHTNNPATTGMAGGHQIVFASNGTVGAAIGLAGNIWTSGTYTGNGSGLTALNASQLTTGTIPAARVPTLNQSTTGNAATATALRTARTINGTSFNGSASITTATWGTARNITVGATAKSVNGSANVAWSLAEIGAAASNHTHTAAAVGAAPASHTHTAAQITNFASAIGAMAHGGVGTYAFVIYQVDYNPTLSWGQTTAGSNLRTSGSTGSRGVALSGTWRIMGAGANFNVATLAVRIS